MKLEKWYEKAGRIFDGLVEERDLIYHNGDDGLTFCDRCGTWAYFVPGFCVTSVNRRPKSEQEKGQLIYKAWKKAVSEKGYILVKKIETGSVKGKKAVRLTNGNNVSAIVNNKFLKPFPKNVDYYVKDAKSPVLVSIWENVKCNPIAIVCPALTYDFKPDSE